MSSDLTEVRTTPAHLERRVGTMFGALDHPDLSYLTAWQVIQASEPMFSRGNLSKILPTPQRQNKVLIEWDDRLGRCLAYCFCPIKHSWH